MMILVDSTLLDDIVDEVFVDAAQGSELLLDELVHVSFERLVFLEVHAPTLV